MEKLIQAACLACRLRDPVNGIAKLPGLFALNQFVLRGGVQTGIVQGWRCHLGKSTENFNLLGPEAPPRLSVTQPDDADRLTA